MEDDLHLGGRDQIGEWLQVEVAEGIDQPQRVAGGNLDQAQTSPVRLLAHELSVDRCSSTCASRIYGAGKLGRIGYEFLLRR
jgi:hypothetical protein